MTTDPTPHLLWITSRAAGVTALVLASAGMVLGLAMGGRLTRGPGRLSAARTLHEALALATFAALALHAVALLGDRWLHPSLADLTIPFVSGYRTFWTGLGIIGAWGLLLLGGWALLRKGKLSARAKRVHRSTIVAWAASVGHAIGSGTDMAGGWGLRLAIAMTVPVLVMLVIRVRGATSRPRSGSPRPSGSPRSRRRAPAPELSRRPAPAGSHAPPTTAGAGCTS